MPPSNKPTKSSKSGKGNPDKPSKGTDKPTKPGNPDKPGKDTDKSHKRRSERERAEIVKRQNENNQKRDEERREERKNEKMNSTKLEDLMEYISRVFRFLKWRGLCPALCEKIFELAFINWSYCKFLEQQQREMYNNIKYAQYLNITIDLHSIPGFSTLDECKDLGIYGNINYNDRKTIFEIPLMKDIGSKIIYKKSVSSYNINLIQRSPYQLCRLKFTSTDGTVWTIVIGYRLCEVDREYIEKETTEEKDKGKSYGLYYDLYDIVEPEKEIIVISKRFICVQIHNHSITGFYKIHDEYPGMVYLEEDIGDIKVHENYSLSIDCERDDAIIHTYIKYGPTDEQIIEGVNRGMKTKLRLNPKYYTGLMNDSVKEYNDAKRNIERRIAEQRKKKKES
tara:strand:+ start:1607 stop:2791 length:1185 start_codon:yes stop_codon:yes gene_type:complete